MQHDVRSSAPTAQQAARPRTARFGAALRMLVAAMLAVLLFGLAYQFPAAHSVAIGGYDAAYTQGFSDTLRDDAQPALAALAGSDGAARWSGERSFLLFPQIGLPAELSLRLRAAPGAPAGQVVTVLLNGSAIDTFSPGQEWGERHVMISGGLLKPSDVLIELRTVPPSTVDGGTVGVLLDQAGLRTSGWPILPYPVPLALAAVAGALLALLRERGDERLLPRSTAIGLGLLALAFLLLYRLQPWYPYPLRLLMPVIDGGLGLLVAARYAPALARRWPALPDIAALGGIGAWLVATVFLARQHVTLSSPGVEKDFSVFARRAAQLQGIFQPSGVYDASNDGVFRADGFYNLGYPLLLWLVQPFTQDNAFLAARLIAAASGGVLLLAGWWLARLLLGRGGGLLALVLLAFAPLVAEYGLYVGTDMPFAAACTLGLAALMLALRRGGWWLVLAGAASGAAFLLRHPGIVLLALGGAALLWARRGQPWRTQMQALGWLVLGFVLVASPQLFVNIRDTGSPLYSQQAKNIWLAAYANSDWSRWYEAPNTIGLRDVMLADPARFFGNWATNLRGFAGAGGEDLSEFGRADQLRLLAFPANWLALAGLALWLAALLRQTEAPAGAGLLLGWLALYATGVTVGLSIVRFALPLVPLYALAAAWAQLQLAERLPDIKPRIWLNGRAALVAGMLLAVLVAGGYQLGTGYVLQHQPAEEVAAVQMVVATASPGERVFFQIDSRTLFDDYSAVAHLAATNAQDATFVLRPASAPLAGQQPVAQTSSYLLYRTHP